MDPDDTLGRKISYLPARFGRHNDELAAADEQVVNTMGLTDLDEGRMIAGM